jgi:hypothetical protein
VIAFSLLAAATARAISRGAVVRCRRHGRWK